MKFLKGFLIGLLVSYSVVTTGTIAAMLLVTWDKYKQETRKENIGKKHYAYYMQK